MSSMGWIKEYRKIVDWEWFRNPHTAHVFEYCRCMANYEDTTWSSIVISRGSFVTSLSKMAVDTGLSVKAVRIALDNLTKTGEITRASVRASVRASEGASVRANVYTLITICNYDKYQYCKNVEGQALGQALGQAKGQAKGQAYINTEYINNNLEEEYKEERKNNPSIVSPLRGEERAKVFRFVPPSVDEVRAYCEERSNGIDPEEFVDHYTSTGWMIGKTKMKDWKAAVRTWERKRKNGEVKEPNKPIQPPPGVKLGYDEYMRPDGTRTYGSGRETIPLNAPPRPGGKYCWSGEWQCWIM